MRGKRKNSAAVYKLSFYVIISLNIKKGKMSSYFKIKLFVNIIQIFTKQGMGQNVLGIILSLFLY